jgi:hypothetical protein
MVLLAKPVVVDVQVATDVNSFLMHFNKNQRGSDFI